MAGSLHSLPGGVKDGETRQRLQMDFALQSFTILTGLSGHVLRSSPTVSLALLPLGETGDVPAGEGRRRRWPGPRTSGLTPVTDASRQKCDTLEAFRFNGFLHGCRLIQLGNTLKSSAAKQTHN